MIGMTFSRPPVPLRGRLQELIRAVRPSAEDEIRRKPSSDSLPWDRTPLGIVGKAGSRNQGWTGHVHAETPTFVLHTHTLLRLATALGDFGLFVISLCLSGWMKGGAILKIIIITSRDEHPLCWSWCHHTVLPGASALVRLAAGRKLPIHSLIATRQKSAGNPFPPLSGRHVVTGRRGR